MKKSKLIAGLLVLIMMFVVACSSPTQSGQSGSGGNAPEKKESASKSPEVKKEAASIKPKTVKVFEAPATNEEIKARFVAVKKLFEQLNPGYVLEIIEGDNKVEGGKLTTMLNSGVDLPHIVHINAGPGRIGVLSSSNLVMQLDDLYVKNKWEDKINSGAFNNYIKGNKIYEVLNAIDAIEVYYQKPIFEKLGLQPPKTSEEFINVLQKIKDSGMTPIALGARDGFASGWIFGNILEAVAGNKAVEDLMYGKAKWNDPPYVKAAEMLADWVRKGYIDKESATISEPDAKARFLDSKQAMYVAGTWIITDIINKKIEDNIGMFVMPSFIPGKEAFPTGGPANSFIIPSKVENVELAEKWMNFVVSEDYAKFQAQDKTNSSIFAFKSASTNPPVGKILAQGIKSIEKGAGYNPSVFIGPQAKEAYFQSLQGIIAGIAKPKEAMDNIEAGREKDVKAGYNLSKK